MEHHWKTFDGDAEVPLFKPIQLALLVPTLVGSGTSAVPEITADPLPSEHREKRSEE